jgi:hypothetical protein
VANMKGPERRMSHPLDDLLSFAERSYIRMQAEGLISHCLAQGDVTAFDDLVEGLVLAGDSSLAVMHEIIEEIDAAKSKHRQEGLGVRQDLSDALEEFGVHLPQLMLVTPPEAFHRIVTQGLKAEIRQAAPGLAKEDEILLEEICADAAERITKVARRMALLGQIEANVRDWWGCLAYHAARSSDHSGDSEPHSPVQ